MAIRVGYFEDTNGFLESRKLPTNFNDEDLCSCIVDYLNAKVKDKTLAIIDGLPIWDIYRYLHASKYFHKK